jgi:hypothetical protein
MGIWLRHSGQSRVSSATGGSVFTRARSALTGLTTKKNSTVATIRNVISALMNSPYRKTLPLIVKVSPEKSGSPSMAAINGVSRDLTRELTTAVNAVPITTATARSTRLPRRMNSRNSLTIILPVTPLGVVVLPFGYNSAASCMT